MKYQKVEYKGSIEALGVGDKFQRVKKEYEEAEAENGRQYDQAILLHKQMIVDARKIWGDGSLPVNYLRDKDVPKPPKLMNDFAALQIKFRAWADRQEKKRQKEVKQQRQREAYLQAQAEARERDRDYRQRSKEMREILESLDYTYGIEFRDNAITFARKNIEEIRPGVWQRIIPMMEELLPAGD